MSRFYEIGVAPPLLRQLAQNVSLEEILESPSQFYQPSDILYVMVSGAEMFLMIPGICLVYSGATDRLSSLLLFRLPFLAAITSVFLWYLWGYALTFSDGGAAGSTWGSDVGAVLLRNVAVRPVGDVRGPRVPEMVYVFFQGGFAAFTAALVAGAGCRGMPVGRFLIFITLWSAFIYYPIARWTWHPEGWLKKDHGVLDFAGGTPVHITSGSTVAAITTFRAFDRLGVSESARQWWGKVSLGTKGLHIFEIFRVGARDPGHVELDEREQPPVPPTHSQTMQANGNLRRRDPPTDTATDASGGVDRSMTDSISNPAGRCDLDTISDAAAEDKPPHDVNRVVLGTTLLWFGWLGFNGGSELAMNMRAVSACLSTYFAAASGGITGLLIVWSWNAYVRWSTRTPGESPRHSSPVLSVSIIAVCDGMISGLVAITPGAGFVPVSKSVIVGIVSSTCVASAKYMLGLILRDAPLYVFSIHTVGGFVGMFMTGLFASNDVVKLDEVGELAPGNHVGTELMAGFIGMAFAFMGTMSILCVMKSMQVFLRVFGVGQRAATANTPRLKRKLLLLDSPGSRQMSDLEANVLYTWRRREE